jgi:hypothetical protein
MIFWSLCGLDSRWPGLLAIMSSPTGCAPYFCGAQRLPNAPLHWQARFYYTPQFTSWIYASIEERRPSPRRELNPLLDCTEISRKYSVRFPVALDLAVRKEDACANHNQLVAVCRLCWLFIGRTVHFNAQIKQLACSLRLGDTGISSHRLACSCRLLY